MEVILLQDVKGLGKKGETKTVSDGYGNNFLIRQKLAVKKTQQSLNELKKQEAIELAHQEELKAKAITDKEKLSNIVLEFKAKAGKDGSMIGEISTKEISKALETKYGIVIDKRKFVDKIRVNAFGKSILKNELYKGVIADVIVHVSEEK